MCILPEATDASSVSENPFRVKLFQLSERAVAEEPPARLDAVVGGLAFSFAEDTEEPVQLGDGQSDGGSFWERSDGCCGSDSPG